MKTKKTNRGKIVKDHDEFIEYDWEDNSVFDKVPRTATKGSGIYALYDDYGLYYIGLSNRSIRSRLKKHTKDCHKRKWKRFSWYHIPNIKYVKDLETSLLRITNPKGNKVKGKFKSSSREKAKKIT